MAVSKVVFTLVILACALTTSSGWFFFRKYPTAKAGNRVADRKCAAMATRGSCEFYSCFEERLSCGRHWYNVKYGLPYCQDFKAFQDRFSPAGQRFINDSMECMGRELLPWYQKSAMNCHDYTHLAFRALSRCYVKHGFCDVIMSDVMNFITVYEPKHLFSRGALKIWKEIIRIAYHCEPQGFKDIIFTLFESIRD